MFRQNRSCFGGGLCIYVKESIASKQLNLHLDKETETIYLEINIRLRKWLIVGLYKFPSQNNSLFLENISKNLSRYLDSYENITLLDFNMNPEDKNSQHFIDTFSLEHLINEPTCFKGSRSCIYLIFTNRKLYLKNTCVTVTGMSDFHKLMAVSLKSEILKAPPKIKAYRKYKTFDENRFNEDLKSKLDSIELDKLMAVSLKSEILKAPPKIKAYRKYKTFDENRFNEDLKSKLDSIEKLDYPLLESIFIDVLNAHAPIATKKVRQNNHQFMTKALRKAIMTRSILKNAYLKTRNIKN